MAIPLKLLVILWLVSGVSSLAGAPRMPQSTMYMSGTFIQEYLVKDWEDYKWQSEYRYMKELGMTYLIFGSTADSKAHQTWYPTKLRGYRQAKGYKDPVDSCLRNAEKMGIKVFLGLNFNADWWAKAANDPTWLYAQMDEGNRIADELYARYKAKYPKAFHGWYWVWEVDNLNYNQPAQKQTLAKALEINVSHLHRINRDMPVMLCPFMNYRVGVNANGYRDLWKYVFANTSLGKGDIFCPQDCVGAGGLTLDKLAEWFAALKQAVDSKPGLRFWVDTETFDQTDWTSGTMDRLVQQLRLVRPYVDTAITFAWSHYYSPNNAAAGWQKTWKDYMANRKLDAQPPTEPVNFKVLRQGDGSVRVSWLPSSDNIGVCGYDIYRNGTRITRHQSGRETKPTVYVDTSAPVSEPVSYEIQAYDFAGNKSARLGPIQP
jgi:hypothetical protein